MAGRSEIFCQSVAVDNSLVTPSCLFLYLVLPENGFISSTILSTSSRMYIPCFLLGGVIFLIFPVSTSLLNVLVDTFNLLLASLELYNCSIYFLPMHYYKTFSTFWEEWENLKSP